MKEEEKKIEESQHVGDQIKEKKKRKVGKEKEGSDARGVIFGLLFLTLAASYKNEAFFFL
jgi:hypothetical protein